MTALTWVVRLIILAFLIVFAVQNTDLVTLRLLPGAAWEMPLVISLLGFFMGGVLVGLLSLLGVIYRQRREISRLKRNVTTNPVAPAEQTPMPPAL